MKQELHHTFSSLDSYLNDEENSDLLTFLGEEDKGYSEIEDSDFFKHALSKLSEEEKKIIIGRYVNGLSHKGNSRETKCITNVCFKD